MHTGKQKQMNASYQASLVNRHIRRFTGTKYQFTYCHDLFLGRKKVQVCQKRYSCVIFRLQAIVKR